MIVVNEYGEDAGAKSRRGWRKEVLRWLRERQSRLRAASLASAACLVPARGLYAQSALFTLPFPPLPHNAATPLLFNFPPLAFSLLSLPGATTIMRLAALPLVLTCLLSYVLETTSAPSSLRPLGQHIPIYRKRPRTRSTEELLSLLRRRKLTLEAKYAGHLARRASGLNLYVPSISTALRHPLTCRAIKTD